tara:strand:- start:1106 stop:1432 length:327 start_codon:yes stop_codon:yes gene_type:complete
MKITKAQLKQLIKEGLDDVYAEIGGPEVDVEDAIQMLQSEQELQDRYPDEYQSGMILHVINRLDTALQKMGDDASHDKATLEAAAALGLNPADYPAPGELEAAIEQRM